MANVKIRYDVNTNELKLSKELIEDIKKELKLSDEQAEKLGGSFKSTSTEAQKTQKSMVDLKGTIAKLGIAAVVVAGVKAFVDLQREIIRVRKETALLTRETGIALDKITSKTLATAKVFDKEYNEVLRAANTVSKEFRISMVDAIDQINDGLTRGLDINGEYLDTLREYSTQVKAAGLNSAQFNELIQTSVQEGIFSDKGIDVVKEATLRIRELTPAARAALDQIGLSSKQIERDLASGQKTIFQVIQEVSKRLGELPPQSAAVGTAIADIFGGPGEDAGLRFITLLQNIDGELEDVSEETQRYIDHQKKLLQAQEGLNEQLVRFSNNFKTFGGEFQGFISELGGDTLRIFNDIIDSFKTASERLEDFSSSIRTIDIQQAEEELDKLLGQQARLQFELGTTEKASKNFFDTFAEGVTGLDTDMFREESVRNLDEVNQKIASLTKKILELKGGEEDVGDEVDETNKGLELQKDKFEKLGLKADRATGSVNEFTEALKEMRRLLEQQSQPNLITTAQEASEEGQKAIKSDILLLAEKVKAKKNAAEQESFIDDETRQRLADKEKEDNEVAAEAAIQGIIDIENQIFEIRQANLQRQIDQTELYYQTELLKAGNNAEAQAVIQEEYTKKLAQLRTKQARSEKKQAIFSALVNTARGIAEALPNIPLSVVIGVLGAAQVAAIASQPIPQFNKGTKRVPGTDTTRDSVLAYLTPGEGVMPVDRMKLYKPAFDAMYDRQVPPDLINSLATNKGGIERYRETILKDSIVLNMDETGFSRYLVKGQSKIRTQKRRMSFVYG